MEGAAPLAAETDALPEAQQAEQGGREPSDHRIGRQEGDGRRGDAHQQQGGDQRRLAADPIAEMAEQRAAQRAGEEGEAEALNAPRQRLVEIIRLRVETSEIPHGEAKHGEAEPDQPRGADFGQDAHGDRR